MSARPEATPLSVKQMTLQLNAIRSHYSHATVYTPVRNANKCFPAQTDIQ